MNGLRFIHIIFILIISLFTYSCAINPVTGQQEFMLVSESQEIQIGKEASPSLRWEFGGEYHDRSLELYLGDIVSRLWQISERPHLPVKFSIQNTSLPNAFAIPGYVAITRGLLSDMENEAQFAAVMGHEIGHVMGRHTAQRISRVQLQQMGLAIGASALEGTSGGDALLQIGAIGSSLLLLKYDRGQELQADVQGVKYMSMLGYDPNQAKRAHMVLERSVDNYLQRKGKSPRQESFMTSLLSTHPRKEVRVSEIEGMIQKLPPYTIKGDGKFANRFMSNTKKMRELNEIYFLYDKAESYYHKKDYRRADDKLRKAINKNKSQSPFYNLLGMIKLQQKRYGNAKTNFNKALSIDPEYQPSIYGMGLVYYYEKNYSRSVQEFKRSLALFPAHLQSHFGSGKSYYGLKKYREAVPHLIKVAQSAPQNPEIHGLLGICFDRSGEIKPAVISYRNQLKVAPDSELGLHAKQRLAVLEPRLK
jgi:predicted Zn-dependent protease